MSAEEPIAPAPASFKPKLAFRVGVTGTRAIPPEAATRLRDAVERVVRAIRDEVVSLAGDARIEAAYEAGPDGAPVEMRMISPLAEGADRLLAEVALEAGYKLLSPLPFEREDYAKDFPATAAAFYALLARAEVVELDGDRSDNGASYESVGRYVVRNCDVLIALWDGKPAKGRGGTAEIVRYAARADMPVWWIDLAGGEPRLIDSMKTFRDRLTTPAGAPAMVELMDYVRRTIVPPTVPPPERHGAIGRLASLHARIAGKHLDPIDTYQREPASVRAGGLWRTYSVFYKGLSPPPSARPFEHARVAVDPYWNHHYTHADALSTAYASRYRSSYVLIFMIGLLLIGSSIVGETIVSERLKTFVELTFMLCIVAVAWSNHVERWHERWIGYRLLAELCRKQEILAPLGRTLPSTEINRIDTRGFDGEESLMAPRGSWVGWYFQALQRAAPSPDPRPDVAKRRAYALARNLIEEQGEYHRLREHRAGQADRRLAIGDFLFVVAAFVLFLCFLVTLFAGRSGLPGALEPFAGLLSATAATIVGLRAYSEFSLLSLESRRMRVLLRELSVELASIEPGAPLASIELGALSHRLSIMMMHDIDGWAQLFRLRTVEVA